MANVSRYRWVAGTHGTLPYTGAAHCSPLNKVHPHTCLFNMMVSHFFNLREEIQAHILSDLSINDKFRLKIVCKRFKYLLSYVLNYQSHLWLIDKTGCYGRTHQGRSYCLIIAIIVYGEN